MAKQLTKVKLGDIRENPLNIHSEDNAEQIRLMAESIKDHISNSIRSQKIQSAQSSR